MKLDFDSKTILQITTYRYFKFGDTLRIFFIKGKDGGIVLDFIIFGTIMTQFDKKLKCY